MGKKKKTSIKSPAKIQTAPYSEKEPTTKTDRLFNWFKNHRFFSWIIVFLTGISLLSGTYQLYDLIKEDITTGQKPRLEVHLVRDNTFNEKLDITPIWYNETNSGLSEPLDVQIAIRNTGKKEATNVQVYLVYNSCCINLYHQTGESVPGAIISDATDVYDINFVSHYTLQNISPSPILDLFENDLKIRLRLNIVIGAPILADIGWKDLNGNRVLTPMIARTHTSFSDSGATHGTFPIKYLITFNEASEPVSGVLYLTIPASYMNSKEKIMESNIGTELIESTRPPDIDDTYITDSKNVKIVNIENTKEEIEGMVVEKKQERYVATELYVNNIKMYVEIDSNDDGFVDSVYAHDISLDTEVERWWQFKYKEVVEFLPISRISSSPEDYADIFWRVILEK